jgi:hypothetical protein
MIDAPSPPDGVERWPKTLVPQLLELLPRQYASVAFEHVVPLLSSVDEMERGELDFVGLTGKLGAEEMLTTIEPAQGVLLAIISLAPSLGMTT